jgi:hypothetical protein
MPIVHPRRLGTIRRPNESMKDVQMKWRWGKSKWQAPPTGVRLAGLSVNIGR